MTKLLVFITVAGLSLSSCKKEEDPTDPVPKLSLVSIGPATIQEFRDSLVLVIAYEDGNGDLGGFPADSNNLFVVDNRIDVPFEFRIQELVPDGAEVPVKGRLNVVLQNVFITGNGNEETVTFDVYAIDRAGNRSNVITTGAVKVVK